MWHRKWVQKVEHHPQALSHIHCVARFTALEHASRCPRPCSQSVWVQKVIGRVPLGQASLEGEWCAVWSVEYRMKLEFDIQCDFPVFLHRIFKGIICMFNIPSNLKYLRSTVYASHCRICKVTYHWFWNWFSALVYSLIISVRSRVHYNVC